MGKIVKTKDLLDMQSDIIADTHAGYNNAQRLVLLMCDVDRAGYVAGNSFHIKAIHQYFTLIRRMYMNLKPLIKLIDRAEIDKVINRYSEMYLDALKDQKAITPHFVYTLYELCEKIYEGLILCPQKSKFWFRISNKELIGFDTVGMLKDKSIFAGRNVKGFNDDT